jgi:hypothetical protein
LTRILCLDILDKAKGVGALEEPAKAKEKILQMAGMRNPAKGETNKFL